MILGLCLLFSLLVPQPEIAEGLASYYTVASSGAVTASGERLDDAGFTCAHPTAPFGDLCLVAADSGRLTVCRVNDRGPWVEGRVLDLSRAAMEALGALEQGTVRVTILRLR